MKDKQQVTMSPSDPIRQIDLVRWKSIASTSFENFFSSIKEQPLPPALLKHFETRIGDRLRELQRLDVRLFFVLFSSVMLCGAVNSGMIDNVTIFGIHLSRDNATLTVLVLFSSILMVFSSVVSLMSDHYRQLLRAYIEERTEAQYVEYLVLQFSWNLGSLFKGLTNDREHLKVHPATVILLAIWIAAITTAAVLVTLLKFYLFVGAMLSIQAAPTVPHYIIVPVVVVSLCSIVFAVGCLILRLPLPYTDSSNLEYLNQLERSNPELAEKIWTNIAERSLARGRRNVAVIQLSILLTFVIVPYLAVLGSGFFSNYRILVEIFIILAVFQSFVVPVLNRIERNRIASLKRFPDRQQQVSAYVRTKRRMIWTRLVCAAVFGLCVCAFFRWQDIFAALSRHF